MLINKAVIGRTVLILMTCGTGALALTGSLQANPEQDTRIGVLSLPQQEGDLVPRGILESDLGKDLASPATSRRIATFNGGTYFMMRGTRGRVCLLRVESARDYAAMCSPTSASRAGLYLGTVGDKGEREIAVIVPDGYRRVVMAGAAPREPGSTIVNNVAFLSPPGATTIQLSGPGRPRIDVSVRPLPRSLR